MQKYDDFAKSEKTRRHKTCPKRHNAKYIRNFTLTMHTLKETQFKTKGQESLPAWSLIKSTKRSHSPGVSEALNVLVSSFHESVVDVSDPELVRDDEREADEEHDDVGTGGRAEQVEHGNDGYGCEHGNHLSCKCEPVGFHGPFADELGVERNGLSVVDSELHEQAEERPRSKCHDGEQEQQ